jgi:hypothetical protein
VCWGLELFTDTLYCTFQQVQTSYPLASFSLCFPRSLAPQSKLTVADSWPSPKSQSLRPLIHQHLGGVWYGNRNYGRDCAYCNRFPILSDGLDMVILRICFATSGMSFGGDHLQITHSFHSYAARVCSSTCPTNYFKRPVIQSKCLWVIGNYPRRTPNIHLHDVL